MLALTVTAFELILLVGMLVDVFHDVRSACDAAAHGLVALAASAHTYCNDHHIAHPGPMVLCSNGEVPAELARRCSTSRTLAASAPPTIVLHHPLMKCSSKQHSLIAEYQVVIPGLS